MGIKFVRFVHFAQAQPAKLDRNNNILQISQSSANASLKCLAHNCNCSIEWFEFLNVITMTIYNC